MTPVDRVVYLGPDVGAHAARGALGPAAEVLAVAPDPAPLAEALADARGLLDASMRVRVTDAMVEGAPRLAVISCATTGSDHIERGEVARRGIPVHTLREDPELLGGLTPAAELTWALLMACARRLPAAVRHVLDGGWAREAFPGTMLRGRTLGLIGCGRIGGWMARYARAFDMQVLGYDPFVARLPEGIEPVPLDDLVARADFVSVHVHLSGDTRGLVSRKLFEAMKPGAVFLNTSRGAVADEAALLDALRSGRLAGAGLDVLEGEPDTANHPLVDYAREHDNLLITPHCGGNSPDAVRVVCRRAAEKIRAALEAAP